MEQGQQDHLETQFIDRYGLIHTLETIVDICNLKAEHVRSNWPENSRISDAWDGVAYKLGKFTQTVADQANTIQGL